MAFWLLLAPPTPAMDLPPGFSEEEVGKWWTEPVGIAFDPSSQGVNRVYVWERAGRVFILENGVNSWIPLLDIRDEVGAWSDYGMLGFALDPLFQQNGYIYVTYVVDRHHLLNAGTPTYDPAANEYLAATIARVTRYTARASDGFRTVDPASRRVLVGETVGTGIPILHTSHCPGSLVFGTDGTLLVSTGDAASWEGMDDGGNDGNSFAAQALVDGIIRPKEDVGAFRSQLLDSLSGKILRLDPSTGDGVPSNPFFDPANPRSAKSRVWTLGVRNPYRMTLRPETGSHLSADGNPGVLVLGDVGWEDWEEINVITGGGQNCGWPLYQGLVADPNYQTSPAVNLDAPNPLGGFFKFKDLLVQETLGTPAWPNPTNPAMEIPANTPRFMHRRPVIDVGRNFALGGPARAATFDGLAASETNIGAAGSPVAGPQFLANTSTGGVFYRGTDFPAAYRGTYFHADYVQGWIKNVVFDGEHRPVQVHHFATGGRPIFIATHPSQGGLYYVDMTIPVIRKITYSGGSNSPPVAVASANLRIGGSPLAVQFSSLGSKDPEKTALKYLWDFGDGATSTAAQPAHTFNAADATRFDVLLTVTDAQGATALASVPVFVNHTLPEVELLSPIHGTKYPLTGATDYRLSRRVVEIPNHPTTTRWNVYLQHEHHEHPEPAILTPDGVATLSPVYSATESFSYRIHLTVTDDLGATVERDARLFPNSANTAPQAAWSVPSQSRRPGAEPLVLDADSTVSDGDSAGIEGGWLWVGGSVPANLSILPEGNDARQVNLTGAAVFFGGVEVGTWSVTSDSLSVVFNEAATPATARAILRRIAGQFPDAGARTFTLYCNDGDGGTSAPATLAINVADSAPATPPVLAMIGRQIPGEPEGSVYASFGASNSEAFAGTIKVGTKVTSAIFAPGGRARVKVGDNAPGLAGAKFSRLNSPSGDAALAVLATGPGGVTLGNDTVLLAGLSAGPVRIAAREGTAFADNPALSILSFGSIDATGGPGGAIFFIAKLKGLGVTPADDTALCAALADGRVRLLVRKGAMVGPRKISIIGTLVGIAGTLGEGRWRADAQTIGVRLTFSDLTHSLYSIPATATDASQWVLWASSGAAGSTLASTEIRSFGLPGFGANGVAALANLKAAVGGATTATDQVIFSATAGGLSMLAREGFPTANLVLGNYRTFGDPVSGPIGRTAFYSLAAPNATAPPVACLWYAPGGEMPKLLARVGESAPGGGKFASFVSLALPDGPDSGPAFTALLTVNATAGVTAASNSGLWAANAAGSLNLLLRTGQKLNVRGKERTVKSLSVLKAVPGAIGAASDYDETHFRVSVTFVDGSVVLLELAAP